jgi:hypothetical protein
MLADDSVSSAWRIGLQKGVLGAGLTIRGRVRIHGALQARKTARRRNTPFTMQTKTLKADRIQKSKDDFTREKPVSLAVPHPPA